MALKNEGMSNVKCRDLTPIFPFEGEIKYDFSKPDGTPRKLLDVSRIKALGWESKINLDKGIKIAYIWYFHSLEERRDRYVK